MKFRINLSYNPIDGNKIASTLEAYQSRHHNEIVHDFENQIKRLTGSKYVVALNSGTAAIHLALNALGVKQDDLVIAPTFTYVATISPILYLQAKPILIDCDAETWNMDSNLVEEAIVKSSRKPKAIIVVHNYGMPALMDELMELSRKYDIPIIEDAAEALGSTYRQRHVGNFGAIGVLSFNNNKVLTTYGGGALLTNDEQVYRKVLHWASHSRENKPYYEHLEIGYNYRMGALNAAAGLAEWPDLPHAIQKRRNDFFGYCQNLKPLGFTYIEEPPDVCSNRWFSTMILPKACKPEGLQGALLEKDIETRLLWKPMHLQPVFKDAQVYLSGRSENLFATGICLPSGKNLSLSDQEEVIEWISKIIEQGY